MQPTAAVVEEGQEHFGRRDGAAIVLRQRATGRAAPHAGTAAVREGWERSRSPGNNKRRRNYSQVTF